MKEKIRNFVNKYRYHMMILFFVMIGVTLTFAGFGARIFFDYKNNLKIQENCMSKTQDNATMLCCIYCEKELDQQDFYFNSIDYTCSCNGIKKVSINNPNKEHGFIDISNVEKYLENEH